MTLAPLTRTGLAALVVAWKEKEDLDDNARRMGSSLPDVVDEIMAAADGNRGVGETRAQRIMVIASRLAGGFGVCGLFDKETNATLALYANMGDSYNETLVWCGLRRRLFITTFADWLESRSRRHGRLLEHAVCR